MNDAAQTIASSSSIDTDKLLACIHCGLCLPSCPTHLVTGEEMPSPRGRLYLMRAVQEGRLALDDELFQEHELSCLVCRACETACPSGVEFGYLMEQTRAVIVQSRPKSIVRGYIYTSLLRSRRQLRLVQSGLALTRPLFPFVRWLGSLLRTSMPRLSAMLRLTPDSIALPETRRVMRTTQPRLGSVALMLGCIGEAFTSDINTATIRVLNWLGYDVVPITQATCCGALSIHAGYRSEALRMSEQMIDAALATDADFIVTNVAGCGAMLKDYEHLLPQSSKMSTFRSKIRDITELIAETALDRIAKLECPRRTTIAYQAPCHLLHAQRISEAPLAVMRVVRNAVVEPLAENEVCCGSAGSYNIEHPVMSDALLQRKVTAIAKSAPDIVLTANAGCLLQLRKGVREASGNVAVYHIIEWLDSLLPNAPQ